MSHASIETGRMDAPDSWVTAMIVSDTINKDANLNGLLQNRSGWREMGEGGHSDDTNYSVPACEDGHFTRLLETLDSKSNDAAASLFGLTSWIL